MTNVNDENYKEVISEKGLVVLDFGAAWCGHCKSLSPIIDELINEYQDKATIAKIDIEDCPDMVEEYGIRSVPSILFIKDGIEERAKRLVGAAQKDKIIQLINELL